MRLWIDENLTPRLAAAAHARGYEATTSRDRSKLRLLDEQLYREVRDSDWILVTNDRQDFERLLSQTDLHPVERMQEVADALGAQITEKVRFGPGVRPTRRERAATEPGGDDDVAPVTRVRSIH